MSPDDKKKDFIKYQGTPVLISHGSHARPPKPGGDGPTEFCEEVESRDTQAETGEDKK